MSKVDIITTRQYLRRRDELFKRVSALTVIELIADFAERSESIFAMGQDAEGTGFQPSETENNSTVASGVPGSPSAGPTVVEVEAEAKAEAPRRPFLLLDIRDKADFNTCHISYATSYAAHLLRHDKITTDLYHYRNRDGHVIIIYDLNDHKGREVATMFTEKGYENIFLLTGGLENYAKIEGAKIDGVLPTQEQSSGNSNSHSRRSAGNRKGRPPLASRTGNRRGGSRLTTENVARANADHKKQHASPRRPYRGMVSVGLCYRSPLIRYCQIRH